MKIKGVLKKMQTEYSKTVHYFLQFGDEVICINDFLGKHVCITYTGVINCIKCGKETKNSFAQGYCYQCFISAPETEDCVLRPELCRAHEGIARDMEFARHHCLIEHIVYLALSPGIKVGVTRYTQIPTRWIDQGAEKAIVLAKIPNRYQAGIIEVALKDVFPDKTNWRNMLSGKTNESVNLPEEKWKTEELLPFDLAAFFCTDDAVTSISYPVIHYPDKIKSIDLDKHGKIEGSLYGIKGQYLIFDTGEVINIRKHGGYNINLEVAGD